MGATKQAGQWDDFPLVLVGGATGAVNHYNFIKNPGGYNGLVHWEGMLWRTTVLAPAEAGAQASVHPPAFRPSKGEGKTLNALEFFMSLLLTGLRGPASEESPVEKLAAHLRVWGEAGGDPASTLQLGDLLAASTASFNDYLAADAAAAGLFLKPRTDPNGVRAILSAQLPIAKGNWRVEALGESGITASTTRSIGMTHRIPRTVIDFALQHGYGIGTGERTDAERGSERINSPRLTFQDEKPGTGKKGKK